MSKEKQETIEDSRIEEIPIDQWVFPWTGKYEVLVGRLGDKKPGSSWSLLYYGKSGAGKTWFCGTAGPRTLFINIGPGEETLLSPLFRKKYPESRDMIFVDIGEKLSEKGVIEVATAFDVICDVIDWFIANRVNMFDTIIIDDATFLRRVAMNKALELNAGQRTDATKAAERMKGLRDYVKPEVGDYGQEMAMIEWMLSQYTPKLKNLGKNFVMTAHQRDTFGKPPKIGDEPVLIKTTPGFTGRTFPDQIPAYFDDVFLAQVVSDGAYRCFTKGTELESGKARHGGIFPKIVINPEFPKMLADIRRSELHESYQPKRR